MKFFFMIKTLLKLLNTHGIESKFLSMISKTWRLHACSFLGSSSHVLPCDFLILRCSLLFQMIYIYYFLLLSCPTSHFALNASIPSQACSSTKSSLRFRDRFSWSEIRLIIFFAAKDGEALYSQHKEDLELTVAQIMSSLLPNSDLSWRKEGKTLDHSPMT